MLLMVIDLCGFTRGDQEVFFSARRTAATPFWTCGVKAPDDDDDGVVVVVVLCANIFGRKSESKKVNGRERVVRFSRRWSLFRALPPVDRSLLLS